MWATEPLELAGFLPAQELGVSSQVDSIHLIKPVALKGHKLSKGKLPFSKTQLLTSHDALQEISLGDLTSRG